MSNEATYKQETTHIRCLPVTTMGIFEGILYIIVIGALHYVQLQEIHCDPDSTSVKETVITFLVRHLVTNYERKHGPLKGTLSYITI